MSVEPAPVSFKLRARRLGGHMHVAIWSSEFGSETTHGRNGEVVFRDGEWAAFAHILLTAVTNSQVEITEDDES